MGLLNWVIGLIAICAPRLVAKEKATELSMAVLVGLIVFRRRNTLLGWNRGECESSRFKLAARKVNDSLYELYKPEGYPTMQVLFFHGLPFGDCSEAHLSTWTSADGSCIWPKVWLREEFPGAHILAVSYGEVLRKGSAECLDTRIIVENLTANLMEANIGQAPHCPVVLVGHSFGGLVIKEICLEVETLISRRITDWQIFRVKFFGNLRGVFYYSTPHHGSRQIGGARRVLSGPLFKYFTALSTKADQLNYEFNRLCDAYPKWQIDGLGELLPVETGLFRGIVIVPEKSARDGDKFNLERADHFSVCRPENKTSGRFRALARFLHKIVENSEAIVHGLPALERRAFEVQQKLTDTQVLGIVGMGGIGKTTIAKKVFENISPQFEYVCFADIVSGVPTHTLHDWLLNQFLRVGTRVDRNSLQWFHFENKKVLIVMDGVDWQGQLGYLPWDKFGDGSRLIITTRDQAVLDTLPECAIYEVKCLTFGEAKKLFNQMVFGEEEIPDHFLEMNHLQEIGEKVVRKCNGLPLTLEVTGSYLRRHMTNAEVWVETLYTLGNTSSVFGFRKDRVWRSFRVIYDALIPEEQEMFLEAGAFFFEQPLERALAAWSTVDGNAESIWANLLERSMVKEFYKTERNDSWLKHRYKVVWVHEQLRDMAKVLSNGAMVSISIDSSYRSVDLIIAIMVKGHTRCLRLAYNYVSFPANYPKLQLELLDNLTELKYLELVNVVPEGTSKNFPRRLSLLKWSSKREGDVWTKMPPPLLPISLADMHDLAVLELEHWEIPEENLEALVKLRNLRILSLSHIQGPVRLPETFGYLSKLRRFELKNLRLTTLPHSFGNLSALEYFPYTIQMLWSCLSLSGISPPCQH